MKTPILRLLLTFIFFISVHTNFSMEYVTHFMQETSKQFDEYSWWVKGPALIVGVFALNKSYDALASKFFGAKAATQGEVSALNQQLQAANVAIVQLQGLNPHNVSVDTIYNDLLVLKKDVIELKDFARQKRVIDLAKIRKRKDLKQSLSGIEDKIEIILENADISPRKKRFSWGDRSPRSFEVKDKKDKKKEKSLIYKKRKNTKNQSLSPFDKSYKGKGTPRDSFNSDSENGKEKEKIV